MLNIVSPRERRIKLTEMPLHTYWNSQKPDQTTPNQPQENTSKKTLTVSTANNRQLEVTSHHVLLGCKTPPPFWEMILQFLIHLVWTHKPILVYLPRINENLCLLKNRWVNVYNGSAYSIKNQRIQISFNWWVDKQTGKASSEILLRSITERTANPGTPRGTFSISWLWWCLWDCIHFPKLTKL